MLFKDQEHRAFYQAMTSTCRDDVYTRALIYTLGICPDTRKRFNLIYTGQEIDPEQLHQPWQTGTSLKVTRLAFNLYTDGEPTAFTEGDITKEILKECSYYSVSDVFCCEYAPYFMQAIKIRYPEYCHVSDEFSNDTHR